MPINAKKKTRQGSMLNKQLRRQNKYSDGWMISTQKMARRDAGLSLCVCFMDGSHAPSNLKSNNNNVKRSLEPGSSTAIFQTTLRRNSPSTDR
jgi:hypothetical protein